MKVKEIVAKMKAGTALTAEELAFMEAIPEDGQTQPTGGDSDAKVRELAATVARLHKEKQALADKVEEITSKDMSEVQKIQKASEKAAAAHAQAVKELEAERSAHASTRRTHLMDVIHGGIRFNTKLINQDDTRRLVEAALNGVEDLSDKAAVDKAIKPFVERNKALILTDLTGGAGTTNSSQQPSGDLDGSGLQHLVTHGDIKTAEAALKAKMAEVHAERVKEGCAL